MLGPDKAVQERGGEVGLEEHPAGEVLGAVEGPGDVREEDLEVKKLLDNYDPNETSSFVGSVHSSLFHLPGNGARTCHILSILRRSLRMTKV